MTNVNQILDLDFSSISDGNNWSTNGSNVIQTTGGKLRLIADNENTFFDRVLGDIDISNNSLRVCFDFDIFRPSGSSDASTTIVFQILKGSSLIGSGSACITGIESSQIVDFHLDRTFEYKDLSGPISIRINIATGYENYIQLKDINVIDFTFDDNVRGYFVFDEFFEKSTNAVSGAVQLKEWKIDGVETLTQDFFNDNQNSIITQQSDWYFSDADIDGENRVSDNDSPKSFNPFVKSWGLDFVNPTPFFGGKPTGVSNGKNYGPGLLNIGFEKPEIINDDLDSKKGAVFIDMDLSKDLRIVIDLAINENSQSVFTSPSYYRRYFIIWDVSKCEGQFYYNDFITGNNNIDQIFNGFLYGLTTQRIEAQTIQCSQSLNFAGNNGVFEYEIDFGIETGQAGINYNAGGVPDRFTIIWNGQIFTSGYVGDSAFDQQLLNAGVSLQDINTADPSNGSGQLLFNKNTQSPSKAILRVEAPLSNTAWSLSGICPQVASNAAVEIAQGDCNTLIPFNQWQSVFVNTSDVLNYIPFNDDVVYSDAALTVPFSGQAGNYRMRVPTTPFPLVLNYVFNIDSNGVISGVTTCTPIGGGGDNSVQPTVTTNDGCFSVWDVLVDVPNGETRKVTISANFAPSGAYAPGSDLTETITADKVYQLGIDGASAGTGFQTSTISIFVTDENDNFIDSATLQRDHANINC